MPVDVLGPLKLKAHINYLNLRPIIYSWADLHGVNRVQCHPFNIQNVQIYIVFVMLYTSIFLRKYVFEPHKYIKIIPL